MIDYIEKLISGSKPLWAFFISFLNYVLFPDKAYQTAAIAVGGAIILDIITKYIALSKEAGGYRRAVKNRMIWSKTLWDGTRIKLVSYLIVFILAGLSYRVTMLTQLVNLKGLSVSSKRHILKPSFIFCDERRWLILNFQLSILN